MQLGLLGGPRPDGDGRIVVPLPRAEPLVLWPSWLRGEEAVAALAELERRIPWERHAVETGGGRVLAPRLECWFAAWAGARYRYSGEVYEGRPLDSVPLLADLLERVCAATGRTFDAAFANYYRDGRDSIGWHADAESDALGPAAEIEIASLSLGARRPFQLRPAAEFGEGERIELSLGAGDLLLMGRGVQRAYVHRVPKREGLAAARLNLTFRRLR